MPTLKNLAAAFLLATALPALAAAAPRTHRAPARVRSAAPAAVAPAWWQRLVNLWGGGGGCVDPDGKPVPCSPGGAVTLQPLPLLSDGGACIDPSGCK